MTYKSVDDVWMSSAHGVDDVWMSSAHGADDVQMTFGCHPHIVQTTCR